MPCAERISKWNAENANQTATVADSTEGCLHFGCRLCVEGEDQSGNDWEDTLYYIYMFTTGTFGSLKPIGMQTTL